ncbi:peptidoglycan recognition protein 1 [Microcaecilia unicolor]|uniref:Peptidoglycan-recognition protein n=1 Tax=Microcaecilia unicolor TaxID=1415580 RepID=A0A6P7ZEP8_9AMPH|nr:peptidoglycan recognition protein 1-like [Microcaecilia unicolor]
MTRLVMLLLLLSALWAIAQGCPPIISRAKWGARSTRCNQSLGRNLPYVFIHHTAGSSCNSLSTCCAQLKGIQNYHIGKKWCDIAYNFLISADGSVYEGRGWSSVGTHTSGYNSKSIAISFIGDFMKYAPTNAALYAAKSLISCAVSRGFVSSAHTLKGHRNVNPTSCPGDLLYNAIKTWPSFRA